MPVVRRNYWNISLAMMMSIAGCTLPTTEAVVEPRGASIAPFIDLAEHQSTGPLSLDTSAASAPATVDDLESAPRWSMSLEEAIQQALSSDYVLRSLGGQIVSQPDTARAAIDPALVQTNAIAGEQAALSEFDSQLRSSLTYTRADRGLKRQILLSDATSIDSLFASFNSVIERRTRQGTVFGFRKTIDYDRDNLGIPPNRFDSAFDRSLGLEMRHPLALGGGRAFNEIAGPGARAGEYRGIVIAQINTSIADHDFRVALRDHLHDVVRTYWGLYLSYADLDAKQESLNIARETLRIAKEKLAEGIGDVDQVYQSEERLYAAEAAYYDSISGPPARAILGILGISGSQLAGVEIGVLALERRLRFQLGLPPGDGRLIRPTTDPSEAEMVFDWDQSLAAAAAKRPELSRQAQVIQKKRMELKAAHNFRLPRLDAVAQYRFRGFGDNYFQSGADDSGAYSELFNGDLQEWVAGLEFEWPAGNRIGNEAVRNAKLSLARELGILEQQHHQVSHEIASAVSELERAYRTRSSLESRYSAARRHQEATLTKFDNGIPVDIETVLDAQRIASQARAAMNVAKVDCEIAMLKINVARAAFMEQLNIAICGHELSGQIAVAKHPELIESATAKRLTTPVLDSGIVRGLTSKPRPASPAQSESHGDIVFGHSSSPLRKGPSLATGKQSVPWYMLGNQPVATNQNVATPTDSAVPQLTMPASWGSKPAPTDDEALPQRLPTVQ